MDISSNKLWQYFPFMFLNDHIFIIVFFNAISFVTLRDNMNNKWHLMYFWLVMTIFKRHSKQHIYVFLSSHFGIFSFQNLKWKKSNTSTIESYCSFKSNLNNSFGSTTTSCTKIQRTLSSNTKWNPKKQGWQIMRHL